MTEFYISRWKAITKVLVLSIGTLFIWAICYFTIPIDAPTSSEEFNHFAGIVLIISAIFLTYVAIFHGFTELILYIRHTPIVVITSSQLQVYDFSLKCQRIFYWDDIEKIEEFSFKGSLSFDIYLHENRRYQQIETSRWRRFMQKLDAISMQGAAVRIPAHNLNVAPRTLYNAMQSHIR